MADVIKSQRKTQSFNQPLAKFSGRCKGIELRKNNFDKQDVYGVFDKVKVIESDSPYDLTTAEVRLANYTHGVPSALTVLEDSIAEVLGLELADVHVGLLEGKNVTLERGNLEFGKDREGKPMVGVVWRLVGLDGAGKASKTAPMDAALDLLDGKTQGDFTKEAVVNSNIRGDSTLVQSIVDKTFFDDDAVTDAYEVDDDGVYHRKS